MKLWYNKFNITQSIIMKIIYCSLESSFGKANKKEQDTDN